MKNITSDFNIYNKPTYFKGKKTSMMSDEEKISKLTNASREYLYGLLEREVPENGKFTKVYVSFDIPATNNQVLLYIEHDEADPKTQRRVILGVRHKNGDRLVSNQMTKGTKKEILEYLKNSNNNNEIKSSILNLSKATDEFYSGF